MDKIAVLIPCYNEEQTIEKVIKDVGATSIKDMGIVMKEAKAKIGAGADGRTINEVAKELL